MGGRQVLFPYPPTPSPNSQYTGGITYKFLTAEVREMRAQGGSFQARLCLSSEAMPLGLFA